MISFSPPAGRRMLTLISTLCMFARSRCSWLNCFSYNWRTPSPPYLWPSNTFSKNTFHLHIKVWASRGPWCLLISVESLCLLCLPCESWPGLVTEMTQLPWLWHDKYSQPCWLSRHKYQHLQHVKNHHHLPPSIYLPALPPRNIWLRRRQGLNNSYQSRDDHSRTISVIIFHLISWLLMFWKRDQNNKLAKGRLNVLYRD